MISNYSKPQLLIKQLLEVLPEAEDSFLNACIIGPHYDLMRVGNTDEKALMSGEAFVYNSDIGDSARQLLAYENLESEAEVDLASVKLYAEDVEGQIAVFGDSVAVGAGTDADYFLISDLNTPNKLRFVNDDTGGDVTGLNLTCEPDANGDYNDIHSSLYGSPIKVGDLAYVTVDSVTVRRVVRAIEQEESPSSFGTNAATDDSNAANSDANPVTYAADTPGTPDITDAVAPAGITVPSTWAGWDRLAYGAKYLNLYGDRYIITITAAASHNGADGTADVNGEARIRTASGTYSADNVTITSSGTAQTFTINIHGLDLVLSTLAAPTVLSVGSAVYFVVKADYDRLDTAASKDITISGTYTGLRDTTYIIKVITGTDSGDGFNNGVIEVKDTAGVDQVTTLTITEDIALNLGSLGLQITFNATGSSPAQDGLRKNDVYYVNTKAVAKNGAYSLLVLNGAVTDTLDWSEEDRTTTPIKIEFRKLYTGFIDPHGDKAPIESYEATEDGVYVTRLLTIKDIKRTSSQWLEAQDSVKTRLYVEYRALRPAVQNEPYKKLRSATDITEYFGKIDMENPLAYGCQQALSGSQGKPIYAIRVPSDNIAGYTEALRILQSAPLFYSLCVMTYDVDIQKVLQSHVEAQSQDDVKKWRRGYVGCQTPDNYAVMTTNSEGGTRTATITANENGYLRVNDVDGEFEIYDVKVGDFYRTNYSQDEWGDATFDEYVIAEIISNEEIILKTGPSAPISPAARYEIWRDNSADNITDYVSNISRQFGSRRIVNVWCDTPLKVSSSSALVEVPTYYIAAEIAGLRSAMLPQQGLTRTEIATVSSIPSMYTKYTEEELNKIAANGTFIIVQEVEDGEIFIRHQLTTDSDNGAMYYEDSVGTNFDNICYECKGVLEQYIGKRNTTPSTLRDIYDDIDLILRQNTQALPSTNLGPALISFTDLRVWVDEILKDRVNAYATLVFPLPINTLELTLNATASLNETNITEISQ